MISSYDAECMVWTAILICMIIMEIIALLLTKYYSSVRESDFDEFCVKCKQLERDKQNLRDDIDRYRKRCDRYRDKYVKLTEFDKIKHQLEDKNERLVIELERYKRMTEKLKG